jgi:DNA (cytosine-5)-methyltransferase 1
MRCVDLFAGCGGLSLGFLQSGFDVVAALDNWDAAIDVYKKNFHHPIHKQDLRDESASIEIIRGYQPDLIMGGPPCQDFSSAGKRDITQGHADLTYHFANIVCEIKPHWFVMENVEQIKKSHILQEVVNQFIATGYGLTSVILDASFCGVPQARTRFFLLGAWHDKHNQLTDVLQRKLALKPMTVRDYLGDKLGIDYYYRHPRNYNRRGIFSIDEPSPTIRGVNRPIPNGYKLNSCDPSGVILNATRPLTTIERSYLQTFPSDFIFSGTKTNLEQMIGNAVPVKLAAFLASAIRDYRNQKGNMGQLSLLDMDVPFHVSARPLSR